MSSEVQIAVIDQQDTQIVLAVPGVQGATGSEIAAGGTANQVLRKASSTNYDTNWSLVTNAMVDSSAAIAGTKISPDFGSQNSVTTGTSTAASFIPTSSTAPTNGVYLPSANNVAISTGGTGRLFVDANGRLGVGTTPDSPLHVVGTSGTGLRIGYTNNINYFDANTQIFRSNNSTTTYGQWDSSGRLLVGTSSLRASFQRPNINCEGLGDAGITICRNNADNAPPVLEFGKTRSTSIGGNTAVINNDYLGMIRFYGANGTDLSNEGARISAEVDGDPFTSGDTTDLPTSLVFSTTADGASSPTERMRIDSAGTLKTYGSTANSSVYNCDFRNSASTDLFRVRNDGYFITGSAANSPYNLTTGSAANVNMDGNGALQRVTSSLKYKRDVQDTVHGLAELLQLRAVTYKGKGENDGETVFGGLIAEEVDAAGLHEFVQYASDGSPDSLAYGNMVSLCVKSIQEQQAIISELQSKVAALEGA